MASALPCAQYQNLLVLAGGGRSHICVPLCVRLSTLHSISLAANRPGENNSRRRRCHAPPRALSRALLCPAGFYTRAGPNQSRLHLRAEPNQSRLHLDGPFILHVRLSSVVLISFTLGRVSPVSFSHSREQRNHRPPRAEYEYLEQGSAVFRREAVLPEGTVPSRASFEQGDACSLDVGTLGAFDAVLASNLLCRCVPTSWKHSLIR